MSVRRPLCQLWRRCGGGVGAEFALVLPILLLFLFGIIDVGRLMWTMNQVEKATQVGVRMAVVTNMVPRGLYNYNYGEVLGQGAPITTDDFGAARCSRSGDSVTCACLTAPCPTLSPFDEDAFDAVVTRMRQISPVIDETGVTIDYTNSGLGFAGDPNGADVAPLVTVTATDLTFIPTLLQLFGGSFSLPPISATLTLEDGAGTTYN